MRRRHLLTLAGALLAGGCTPSQVYRGAVSLRRLERGDVSGAVTAQLPGTGNPIGTLAYKTLARKLLEAVTRQWEDGRLPRRREVVKYTDHYQSRALIDFSSGHIRVQTRRDRNALKEAIILTLLAPEDPSQFDLFSDRPPKLGATPFLYQLVTDQHGQPIRWRWRAARYADWLLQHRLHVRQDARGRWLEVDFHMVDNIPGVQRHKYAAHVLRQSRRWRLDPALVWAIIEVESAFNPWAVSPAPAYGLMQIVPRTAGRDAHRRLYGRTATPSRQTLFIPARNIEYGCAYLHLLRDRYLAGIRSPSSRLYCVIAAYNTGAGNVLRAFSHNRAQALRRINAMTPTQVYDHLRYHLSHAEARNYVVKVTRAWRRYRSERTG